MYNNRLFRDFNHGSGVARSVWKLRVLRFKTREAAKEAAERLKQIPGMRVKRHKTRVKARPMTAVAEEVFQK